MKQHHDSKILEFARKLGSREAGFIFAVLGVLSQWVHVFYITYHLSSLSGITKFLQAGTMSLFFNAALLYFILKRGSVEDEDVAKRYGRLIWWFAALEIFMNCYYWGSKFIIDPWPAADWSKLIIAVPMAIILPITLAAYSFEIRVDDFSENSEYDTDNNSQEVDPLEEQSLIQTGIIDDIKSLKSRVLLENGSRVNLIFKTRNGEDKILKDVTLSTENEVSSSQKLEDQLIPGDVDDLTKNGGEVSTNTQPLVETSESEKGMSKTSNDTRTNDAAITNDAITNDTGSNATPTENLHNDDQSKLESKDSDEVTNHADTPEIPSDTTTSTVSPHSSHRSPSSKLPDVTTNIFDYIKH